MVSDYNGEGMDTLNSTDAANRLGVNPQRFHRLVAHYEITPVLEAPGIRGVKFWNTTDIERIAEAEAQT